MASTSTTGLRLELIADGEASNTWGQKTNTNLAMLDRAVSGYIVYPMTDGTNTLSATDYLLADWHNMGWKLTGALTADASLRVPAFEKVYIVENATTGAFTVTVKTVSGTGAIVPQGQRAVLICDGTNVIGTVIQPYSANTASIAAIASPGFLSRKADGTWINREIKGTDEQITVTQGLGDTANPTLSLNTNLIAPGSLRVTSGLTVAAGGLTVAAGGLTVTTGASRFMGDNASVEVLSSSGFGSMKISGPAGSFLDLKNVETEHFDLRLVTNGNSGGGELTAAGTLDLKASLGGVVNVSLDLSLIATFNSFGLGVYSGLVDIVDLANDDSKVQWRNNIRTWDAGVRPSGGWSLRSAGTDTITVAANGATNISNAMTVAAGSINVVAGDVTANVGNFRTDLASRSVLADATTRKFYVKNGGVGIDAPLPQQALHIGNNASSANAVLRVETGGPLGFRQWDFGAGYGDFNFLINDATGGVRRLTINWQTGVTALNGGLAVTGAGTFTGTVTASSGLIASSAITLTRAGGGNMIDLSNSQNTGEDGAQVRYGGTNVAVFTRVSQTSGNFEFVNSAYSARMLAITQGGACLNATGTYGTLSDIRLKDHVSEARDHTEDLMKLRVIEYSLKSDELDHADKIGFVAQEVQAVLPELILEAGDHNGVDNALAVATSNLTPLIVQALQNINRRLEAIENAT